MSARRLTLRYLWGFLFMTINSVAVLGQASLNLSYQNPAEIIICGNAVEFEVEVRNITTSTVTGISVEADLPSGVNYVSGSVTGNGASEASITNLNKPVFSITDLAITEAITFKIKIKANCDLSTLVNNGGLATIKLTANYSGGSLSITTKPVSVREPALNFKSITNQFKAVNLGDTVIRTITLYNTGQGGAHNFIFTQINQNGMKVIGSSGGNMVYSNDTIRSYFDSTHFKAIGNNDAVFDLNETVVIYDTIVILECERLKSTYDLRWGCEGKFCNKEGATANFTVTTRAPKLTIVPTDGSTACLDEANDHRNGLRIVNTGNDTARKFELNIFNSYNGGYYSRILSEIVVSTIRYKHGKSGSWSTTTPVGVELVDTSGYFDCLSAYPVGSVTLNLPDIDPGDTMFVEWISRSCCPQVCSPSFWTHRWRYLPSYYDQCGTKIIDPEFWGSGGDLQSFSMTSTTPPDVLDGEKAKFIFTVSNNNLLGHSRKSRLDARFILPSGFTHSLNKDDFAFYNLNGGSWKPQSVLQKGDTIYARFSGYPTTTLRLSELIVKVTGTCNSAADHGTGTYYMDLFYNPDTTCTTGCKMHIYCGDGDVKLHCITNCKGGMAFRSFVAERISLGKPDNDNNGLPDASGSLDLDKIKKERIVYGDTLLMAFRGKITAAGSVTTWRYGKAKSVIPFGRYLKVADARIKIYRNGNLLYNCGNLSYTTSLSGNTRTIEFDFGIPALISSGCPLYSGFQFFSSDSVNVEVMYVVDPNPGNFIREITSTNEFYMSTVASPSASQKYQCDTFSGRFVLAGTYFANCCTNNWYTNSCDVLTISNNFYLSVANCCSNYAGGNFFPFEYRPWAKLAKVLVLPPKGFAHVYSNMYQYRTSGSSLYTLERQDTVDLSWSSSNNDTLVYDVAKYYKDSSGTINISDDGFTGTFMTRYIPTCEALSGNSSIRYIFVFERKGVMGSGYDTIEGGGGTDNIYYNRPDLKINAQETDVKAYSDTVEWRLRISNNSTFSDARYLWVGALGNANVRLLDAIDLSNNSTIALTPDLIRLGDLKKQATMEIIVRAVYQNCNPDSIELLLGANCIGYPDSISAYPCVTEKLMLRYQPVNTRLDVNLVGLSDEVNLCEPVRYTMKILNTGQSRVYDLFVDLVMRTGMVLKDTAWLRFEGLSDSVMVTGKSSPKSGIIRWDLAGAEAGLKNYGLGGINDPVSAVYFTFTLETDCDFASSSYLLIKPGGFLKCGDPVNAAFEIGDPIDIKGITKPYFAALSFEIDPFEACRFGGTAKFNLLNLGPDSTNSNDRIQLIIPQGIYVDSLVLNQVSNAPLAYSGITTSGGSKTIEWPIPSGIKAGDSSVFTISVSLNPEELPCEGVQIFAQSVVKQPALCVKDSTWCDINVVTSDDLKLDSVRKSQFELVFYGGQAFPSPGQEQITMDYGIRNTGIAKDSGAITIIRFVYDKNGNGLFDPGETVVFVDSFADRVDLNYLNRSVRFGVQPEQSCRLLLVVDSTNCVCSPTYMTIPPLPLRNAGRDTTVCSFERVQVGDQGLSGNTYAWSPVKGFESPDSAMSWFMISNSGFKDSIYQLVLTTDKGPCITRDTVSVTVHPRMRTNLRDQATLCRGDSLIIGNLVTGGTGFRTYQWSPVTGVTYPNNTKTYAKPVQDVTYTITVTDGLGCVHKDSTFIDVLDIPVASLTKQDTCADELFTFTDISTYPNSGFDSVRWEITGIDTYFNSTNWYRIMDTAGVFALNLYVQDSFGCHDDTATTLTIYPNPVPGMRIHNDCQFDTTLFTDESSILSGNYTVQWVFQGDTLTGSPVIADLTQNGTSDVQLIATSEKGCVRTLTQNITTYGKPQVGLADTFMCLNDSITLAFQVVGDSIAMTTWNFNGQISNDLTLGYASSDTGTYPVQVITETKFGCLDTANAYLTVHPLPVTGIDAEVVCEGDSNLVTSTSVISKGSIVAYWWETTGNYVIGSDQMQLYYPDYGQYPVSLAVVSEYGCTDTATSTVTVNYMPVPDLVMTGNCEGTIINFEHQDILPDSIRTINWFVDGAGAGSGNSIDYRFNTDGDHTVELIITSNAGCVADSVHIVTIDPKPTAMIEWSRPCEDDEVHFTDNSVTPSGTLNTRLWTMHDNTTETLKEFDRRYGTAGNFAVQLEVSNSFGCKDTAYDVVRTNPAVDPSFTIDDVCAGEYTRVRNTSSDLSTTITDIWFAMGNGDTIRGQDDFQYRYPKDPAGQKTVTLGFETLPGCVYTTTGNVQIYQLPDAGFNVSPLVGDILNSTVFVRDKSTGGTTVFYNLSDGSFYSRANFDHRFLDSGTYVIEQVVMNDQGCADTVSTTVRINFIYTFFVPNTVTPDGNGVNDVFKPTGYGIVRYDMFIFNRWGEILFRSKTDQDAWDPGDIMQGVYFYKINVIDYENMPHSYTGSIHVIR